MRFLTVKKLFISGAWRHAQAEIDTFKMCILVWNFEHYSIQFFRKTISKVFLPSWAFYGTFIIPVIIYNTLVMLPLRIGWGFYRELRFWKPTGRNAFKLMITFRHDSFPISHVLNYSLKYSYIKLSAMSLWLCHKNLVFARQVSVGGPYYPVSTFTMRFIVYSYLISCTV